MPTQMTRRQKQVLDLIVAGLSNKQIAARLGLSESAVKQHISLLLRNFGVRTRTALVAEALREEPRPREGGWRDIDLAALAPVAIAVTRGPDHVYAYVNEEFIRLTRRSQVIGLSFLTVFPGQDEHPVKLMCDSVFRSGRPAIRQQVLSRIPQPDGRERVTILEVSCHPIRDDGGSVEGVLSFANDLTEYIQLTRATTQQGTTGAMSVAMRAVDGLRAMHEVSAMTGARLDRLSIIGAALAVLRAILQVPSAALFAARTDGSLRLVLDDNKLTRPRLVAIPPNAGAAGQALSLRAPVVINDYKRSEHAIASIREAVDAAAAVPVERSGLVVGVVAVQATVPRVFGAADTEIMSMFAGALFEELDLLRSPGDVAELGSGPGAASIRFELAAEPVSE